MRSLFRWLRFFVRTISLFVFASGVIITALGGYDFFHALSHISIERRLLALLAVGLLQSVDLFLMAIVFFIFSLGVLVLFTEENQEAMAIPSWLRIKSFVELKIILWEAILTTMVVSFVAGLVQKRIDGHELSLDNLIIPAATLILAISLFFLKRGGNGSH
jgi:uncharacterized membrane protein YqhA